MRRHSRRGEVKRSQNGFVWRDQPMIWRPWPLSQGGPCDSLFPCVLPRMMPSRTISPTWRRALVMVGCVVGVEGNALYMLLDTPRQVSPDSVDGSW